VKLYVVLLSAAMLFADHAKNARFLFAGTVSYGEPYSHKLPNGLLFELQPEDCGWMVSIHPPGASNQDYVWPENPPVRQKNELFLDDSYDGDWESPLRHVHRIFFARTRQQAQQKLDWIDAFNHGDDQKAEKLDLPQSALGEIRLSIVSYKKIMVEQKIVANPKDHWCADDLRFRVVLSRR
jgi:hypothetical protein